MPAASAINIPIAITLPYLFNKVVTVNVNTFHVLFKRKMEKFSEIIFSKNFIRTALYNNNKNEKHNNKINKSFTYHLGKFNIPSAIRTRMIPLYFKFLGNKPSFFDHSFYRNFSEVFRQPVTSNNYFTDSNSWLLTKNTISYYLWKNPIEHKTLRSPVEGYILNFGKLCPNSNEKLLNVKSTALNIKEIINRHHYLPNKKELNYFVIYLSPSNYHRFHAPINFTLKHSFKTNGKLRPMKSILTHIKEKLLNKRNVENFSEISLKENRKLTIEGESNVGSFSLCAIGSSRVGCINLNTPFDIGKVNTEIEFKKGDELGHFDISGSAIAIVFENENFVFNNVKENMKIELGQSIGEFT